MFAVIGDVHACLNTLKALHEKIKETYGDISIYCTGDLVDRGNFPSDTIIYVMENNILPVLGNHDRMFYCYYKIPKSYVAGIWIPNSASKTIFDYKRKPYLLEPHLDFVSTLPSYYFIGDFFLSHAGIAKKFEVLLDEDGTLNIERLDQYIIDQNDTEPGILWTRADLLNVGKTQIVGHTPLPDCKYDEISNTYYIDTFAVNGDKLTAIIVDDDNKVDFLSVSTDPVDIAPPSYR
jgi:serine/threonine protein phosphatase 1